MSPVRSPDRWSARMISSGVSSATFSMSMPPSVEAITTLRECGPVEQNRQVELAGDVDALFDVETVDLLAGRAGLNCHQSRAQHLPGKISDGGFGGAHTAFDPGSNDVHPAQIGDTP